VTRRRRVAVFAPAWALVASAALLVSACGYGLAGRNVSLPDHIKKIAVSPFVNRTAVSDLDSRLQKAVLAELQSRGRWKVVPDATSADVDAVVSGTITGLPQTAKAFDGTTHLATRYEIAITATVDFKDLRDSNKVLWSNPSLVATDEYPVTPGASISDPSTFLRQHDDVYQRLATKFARMVVTAMLEGM
jgi:hypothetical protein